MLLVILEPSPDGVLSINEAGEEDRGCDTQSSERSSNQGSMAVVIRSSPHKSPILSARVFRRDDHGAGRGAAAALL